MLILATIHSHILDFHNLLFHECFSLFQSTTAQYNTAVGFAAAYGSTTGERNVAIGWNALYDNTTGWQNVAVGYQALANNTTGRYNTSVGYTALLNNTTGQYNTAIGHGSLDSVTTGIGNTAVGMNSGYNTVGGSNNTSIGRDAAPTTSSASNEVTLGNSLVTALRCQQTSITSLSDRRDKTNIRILNQGIDFIKALKPVSFEWNRRDGFCQGVKDYGFIAQDLQELEDRFGVTQYTRLVLKTNPDKLEARPLQTYPILIKAVQQLIERVEFLENRLSSLKTIE